MGIVAFDMHTYFVLIACLIDVTVSLDVVVVADALIMKTDIVTDSKLLKREPLIALCRTAMNYN